VKGTDIKAELILVFTLFTLCSRNDSFNKSIKHDIEKEPIIIVIEADSIIIQWDAPDFKENISKFDIFYRSCYEVEWRMIGSAPNENTFFTIYRSLLPDNDSIFEFAISSVTLDGVTSNLAISVSTEASPISGWFISWKFN